MEFLTMLWLPIVVAAVFVFIVSSVIHMCLQSHKDDCRPLPEEALVLEALRQRKLEPGSYVFPCPPSMKEMGSPEMVARYNQGPVGRMIIQPLGPPAIGKSLVQWFVYTLLVGVFVAYVARLALGPGAAFLPVFRLTGTVAVLAYAVAVIPDSIWKGHAWRSTGKYVLDGVAYGVVTGAAFGWLWPGAA